MVVHASRKARMQLRPVPAAASAPHHKEYASEPARLAALVAASAVARRAALPTEDPARVARLGHALEKDILANDPDVAPADLETRVYAYYVPIYLWMRRLLTQHRADDNVAPLVVGFSCPQGGGKTTMVGFMRKLFALEGVKCAGASLDDFYLTHNQQNRLAARNWTNGLLRYRGNPGTHDVDMLCTTLDRVNLLNSDVAPPHVSIPQYDKTCFNGRGDRRPASEAELVPDGLDVFLLEGWCMGFQSVGQQFPFEDPAVSPSGCLRLVDSHLEHFGRIYDRLHGMLVIEVDDLSCVYDWRAQPEREAIAAGKPGMTPDEVEDFVSRFMPSYHLYTRALYQDGAVFPADRELHIKINSKRQPV